MTRKRRALFLDRDGVINIDHGYVCRPEEFEFVEGIFDLCRKAQDFGYLNIVVTNQAGIGRGYYTEQQFHELSDWMLQQFISQGIMIDHVYFCPFHPEHGLGEFRQESIFRKPGPGMILQAAREYGLDLGGSILVGDKETDIEAGIAAEIGLNILYRPDGDGHITTSAGIVISSLRQASQYMIPKSDQ